ncbi:hypothetical protein Tco_0554298 [Tanacetum coccineum]
MVTLQENVELLEIRKTEEERTISTQGGQYARGAKDALDYILDCTLKDLCASYFEKCIVVLCNIKTRNKFRACHSKDSTVTILRYPANIKDLSDIDSPDPKDLFSKPPSPDYFLPEDDVLTAEEQPLPVAASPTTESPGYIPESDPEEDPRRMTRRIMRRIQPTILLTRDNRDDEEPS